MQSDAARSDGGVSQLELHAGPEQRGPHLLQCVYSAVRYDIAVYQAAPEHEEAQGEFDKVGAAQGEGQRAGASAGDAS